MSAKSAQKYHINHASVSAVKSWQQRIKKRILRLEKSGFVIAMVDEAFFIRDVKTGKKYWSLITKRIFLPYTGRHEVWQYMEQSQFMGNNYLEFMINSTL